VGSLGFMYGGMANDWLALGRVFLYQLVLVALGATFKMSVIVETLIICSVGTASFVLLHFC